MSFWLYSLILIELIIISIIDIKTKKISNFWPLSNIIFGLIFYLFFDLYDWSWPVLIYPVVWLGVGFVLFLIGIMGAGDSKLLSSLFLLIPLDFHHLMLEQVIISTLVVGFVNLIMKMVRDFRTIKAYAFSAYWKGFLEKIKSRFSFAPVVLIAWILLGVRLWN